MVKHQGFAVTDFILDLDVYKDLNNNNNITYMIVGAEVCPTTERNHWHIFIYFTSDHTLNSIRKKLPQRDVRAMYYHSWPGALKKYCSKDGNLLLEIGECPSQGKRKDLNSIKEMVKNGADIFEVVEDCENLQQILYAEKLFKYKNLQTKRKIMKIDVIWISGDPGTGKSKLVHELEPDLYVPVSSKWWDGYHGQEAILIDDFRPGWCSYDDLLKLTDIYPRTVEVKGGTTPIMWKRMYFTSPHEPKRTFRYMEDQENNKQVLRRITAQFDLNTCSYEQVLSQLRRNGGEVA